jgi:hypothetical protein
LSTTELGKSLTSRGSNYTKSSSTYQITRQDTRMVIDRGYEPQSTIAIKNKTKEEKV